MAVSGDVSGDSERMGELSRLVAAGGRGAGRGAFVWRGPKSVCSSASMVQNCALVASPFQQNRSERQ